MRKTLSVTLAVYNEENNLSACLDSIKDIADEIVVVDGSSKDKTVDIARKFRARVKITTNKPVFHINKQMAIDMATKDWVLQLDADERVTEKLADEIISKINQESNVNGYWLPRKNWFLGRFLMKGGQYPDYTLRLYKRGKGRLPQKDVHEQAEVDGEVSYIKNPFLHYPYKNFNDYIFKWNRYTDLIAVQTREKIENKNIVSRIFFGIGLLFIKPLYWFFITYIRHKGFMDLWSGFVFSLFSSLRFPVSYIKYLRHTT